MTTCNACYGTKLKRITGYMLAQCDCNETPANAPEIKEVPAKKARTRRPKQKKETEIPTTD